MLDRSNQIHAREALEAIADGRTFTPIRYLPGEPGTPSRVVWADMARSRLERPVFDEEFLPGSGPAFPWFAAPATSLRGGLRDGLFARPLGGLIFHVARCGSTLARRLLGAVPDRVVFSEPGVLNTMISADDHRPLMDLFSCLEHTANKRGARAVVKCTSWNLFHADRVLEGAGSPPAIFIHRDPGEVLASLQGADWFSRIPEADRPSQSVSDPDEGNGLYLEALMRSGLRLAEAGRVRCVEYPDLKARLLDGDLPAFLGYEVDAETRTRMEAVTQDHSKNPGEVYTADRARKAKIVAETPAIQRAADRLKPLHEALRGWSVTRGGAS